METVLRVLLLHPLGEEEEEEEEDRWISQNSLPDRDLFGSKRNVVPLQLNVSDQRRAVFHCLLQITGADFHTHTHTQLGLSPPGKHAEENNYNPRAFHWPLAAKTKPDADDTKLPSRDHYCREQLAEGDGEWERGSKKKKKNPCSGPVRPALYRGRW